MKLAKPSVSKMIAMGIATAACTMALAVPAFADEVIGLVDEGGAEAIAPRSTVDYGFDFRLDTHTTHATKYIPKDDASSSYVHATHLDYPCQLFIEATGDRNVTVNGRALLKRKGEFSIKQNVYELGYRTARMTGWRSGLGTIASGVWSADSWGTYTVINSGYAQ